MQDFLKYMANSCEENAKSDTLKAIHQVTQRIKSNEEVSIEYMKIFEKERWLTEKGIEQGHYDEAKKVACELFRNGVGYEVVRASIKLLTDEELQEIYNEIV